jgi:hypothetical protein
MELIKRKRKIELFFSLVNTQMRSLVDLTTRYIYCVMLNCMKKQEIIDAIQNKFKRGDSNFFEVIGNMSRVRNIALDQCPMIWYLNDDRDFRISLVKSLYPNKIINATILCGMIGRPCEFGASIASNIIYHPTDRYSYWYGKVLRTIKRMKLHCSDPLLKYVREATFAFDVQLHNVLYMGDGSLILAH